VGWAGVGFQWPWDCDERRKWGMTGVHVSKDVCVPKTFMRQQQEMHGNGLGWAARRERGTCVSPNGAGQKTNVEVRRMIQKLKIYE